MNVRDFSRAVLAAVLLLLAAGPGLAQGPQITEPSEVLDASATLAANAPWFKTEVDTANDTGQSVSIAIDPVYGTAVISYYDATSKVLRMARSAGSAHGNCGERNEWVCQTVDATTDVGNYNSIAIYGGTVIIAYHTAKNGSLKVAMAGPPSPWEFSRQYIEGGTLESPTGLYPSVAYEGHRIFISYSHYSVVSPGFYNLRVAESVNSGGNCGSGYGYQWKCQTIHAGEGAGGHTSLALDKAGKLHVAYRTGSSADLWYATNRVGTNCGPGGNTWTCYQVATANDVGQYVSMYVDSANRFHIAYYDATNDELKYAVNVGGGGNCGILGSAQCDTIDSMQQGYHPVGISIAEDGAGYPIIAYQSEYGSLNVARPLAALGLPVGAGNCGPENLFLTWYCETIDRHGTWVPYRNGDFASIAVNSSGLATIAYNGFVTSSGGNLNVAYQRLETIFLPLIMKRL